MRRRGFGGIACAAAFASALQSLLATTAFARKPIAACEDPTSLIPRSGDVWRLWPTAHGAVWASSRNGFFRWDGCHWSAAGQPDQASSSFSAELWSPTPRDTFVVVSYMVPRDKTRPRPPGAELSDLLDLHDDSSRTPPVRTEAVTVLLRQEGGGWREISRWRPFRAVGLWGPGPKDLWIAGREDDGYRAPPVLLRWNGRSARPVNLPGLPAREPIEILGGTSAHNAWLVAGAQVQHWDGRRWSPLPTVDRPGWHPSALWGTGRGDLWAASSASSDLGAPAAFHFDGQAWKVVSRPAPGDFFRALGGAGRLLFARTADGSIFQWTGTAWALSAAAPDAKGRRDSVVLREQHPLWTSSSFDLALSGESGGLALGDSTTLLSWNGQRWVGVGGQPSQSATWVWESPAGEAWATTAVEWDDDRGPRGGLLREREGRWERVADAPERLLRVSGAGAEVWAVGLAGTAVRCHAGVCAVVPTGTRDDLVGVWPAAGRIAAAGRAGTVLIWDGNRFEARTGTQLQRLSAVWGADDGTVAAIGPGDRRLGTDGFSLWDGKDWSGAGNPCANTLEMVAPHRLGRVAARSRSDIWAIGGCTMPTGLNRGCGSDGEYCSHGVVAHWDGKHWVAPRELQGMKAEGLGLAVTAGEVWVTGADGLLLRRGPEGWRQMDAGRFRLIRGVAPSARGGLWIIADREPTPRYVVPKPM